MQQDMKKAVVQFVKFNLVGVLNTLVDFLAFTLLTKVLLVPLLAANPISYSCGLVNSYLMNSRWTFRGENKRTPKQTLLFLLVNLLALGVSTGVLWFSSAVLHIEEELWCKILATPASLIVNFLGNKLVVFR